MEPIFYRPFVRIDGCMQNGLASAILLFYSCTASTKRHTSQMLNFLQDMDFNDIVFPDLLL